MYTYIKYNVKGKYVQFPEQLNANLYDNLGTTYQDYLDGKWVLLNDEQLSFKEQNPDANVEEVFYMKLKTASNKTASQLLQELNKKILEYDSSSEVNIFYINGLPVWLDKATRTGLKLRFEAEAASGQTETTLWYNNVQFPLTIESAIKMLYAIELYASACYDNTQKHLAIANSLVTAEEIENYDYKSGYPEKINF